MKMFSLQAAIADAHELHGVDVSEKLRVPPEIRRELDAIRNNPELEFVEDVLEGLDEYDVLNVPIDEWWDKVAEKVQQVDVPFTECD